MSETMAGPPFDGDPVQNEWLSRLPRPARHSTPGETRAFRNSWTDGLLELISTDPRPPKVAEHLERLSTLLLAAVDKSLADLGEPPPRPVVILRGGLLMLEAARNAIKPGPWGFVSPGPRERGEPVAIDRIDIPIVPPGGNHLLVDTIVNTGETVLATLAVLERLGIDTSPESVRLASVFLTERGERAIRSCHPGLEIYTVWSDMTVEPNGWVSGIGFDAGDCAVGGGERLRWATD